MPIFFQQDIDEYTKLGVWKIEESEEFFLEKVMAQREVSHPHKKLQHLAGRYLLIYLFPDFPIEAVRIADTRKPFLENEQYHFSIAHCGNYAAAIVSSVNRVGLDAELVGDKIYRIKTKFISPEEEHFATGLAPKGPGSSNCIWEKMGQTQVNSLFTLIWSSKEAVFKWYGSGGVDFKDHMHIISIIDHNENQFSVIVAFRKYEELFLNLRTIFLNGTLCLSYVVT
ncbi:MAG: hypothetical protein NVS1B13_23320 [Flavisolibacter sp.]